MSAVVRLEALRPVTRADCADGPRPCPWIRCRHHLLIEAALVGRERLERSPAWAPGLRVHPAARRARTLEDALRALPESCALDVAAAHPDGAALETIGEVLGVTRERVRQVEALALRKLTSASAEARSGLTTRQPSEEAPTR